MHKLVLTAAAAMLLSSAAATAQLVVGDNSLSGTTFAAEPQLGGTVVEDVLTPVSFNVTGGFTLSANVQSRVVAAVDGTYDFYWRITDVSYNGTDQSGIGALRIGGFGSVVGENGNYRIDSIPSSGLNPDILRVFANPVGAFNFIFGPGLTGGTYSDFMFVDTDAHAYAQTAQFDLIGTGSGISSLFGTFAPIYTPEPSTWAMMLLGFGAIGYGARRRKPRMALSQVA